ncbi:GTP cyclohydrolase I FolE [Alicyclobacillaceae bacterium I2511]|nr:GTP cyclohydrolase I FolE [Alicyclobacillaceae bacterium I2511]
MKEAGTLFERSANLKNTDFRHELDDRQRQIASHVQEILRLTGEDDTREGLLDTPARVAKMFDELLGGTNINPDSMLSTTFNEHTDGPVIVSNITFYSLCEHHMLPFFGKAHVAYLPDHTIVGISKLARLVDVLARRLQVQERLTQQIVDSLQRVLHPLGAIALVEAEHTCMAARGIKKPGSTTLTLATTGIYRENESLRREFLQMLGKA